MVRYPTPPAVSFVLMPPSPLTTHAIRIKQGLKVVFHNNCHSSERDCFCTISSRGLDLRAYVQLRSKDLSLTGSEGPLYQGILLPIKWYFIYLLPIKAYKWYQKL